MIYHERVWTINGLDWIGESNASRNQTWSEKEQKCLEVVQHHSFNAQGLAKARARIFMAGSIASSLWRRVVVDIARPVWLRPIRRDDDLCPMTIILLVWNTADLGAFLAHSAFSRFYAVATTFGGCVTTGSWYPLFVLPDIWIRDTKDQVL